MGLLDKLLNKDGSDGEADAQTSDWLAKLDAQISGSKGGSAPPPPIPQALQSAKKPGPDGEISEHLEVLDLKAGATWSEVSEAHRSAIARIGDYGDQDQKRRINGAYAALRVNG